MNTATKTFQRGLVALLIAVFAVLSATGTLEKMAGALGSYNFV